MLKRIRSFLEKRASVLKTVARLLCSGAVGFLCIVYPSFVHADCEELIAKVAKKMYSGLNILKPEKYHCKVWPYAPDKTILVFMPVSDYKHHKIQDLSYDMVIAVVDTQTEKVIASLYEKSGFMDHSSKTPGIIIDTARYNLNTSTRAFGIVFPKHRSTSHYEHYGKVLNLYYLDGSTIKPVLKKLCINKTFSEYMGRGCEDKISAIKRTLSMETSQHSGFNDIRINEVFTKYQDQDSTPTYCVPVAQSTQTREYLIEYKDGRYPVSEEQSGSCFE